MNEDKRNEMRLHFAELLAVQEQLRCLVASAGIRVELDPDPEEPSGIDQLADAMNLVRANAHRVQIALNAWDYRVNGCETRTRNMIINDIDYDETILAKKASPGGPRTRQEIQGNIAYDHMQLGRI